MIRALKEYEANVTIYDPWANPEEVKHEYGLEVLVEMPEGTFDAVVVAVAHKEFEGIEFSARLKTNGVLYQMK